MDARKLAIQREFVREQIDMFNQKRAALVSRYNMTDGIKLVTFVSMLWTGYWAYLAIVGCAADIGMNNSLPVRREDLQQQFDNQKNKLVSMIHEYWKEGAGITANENFLNLLEAISPYIGYRDLDILLPKNMRNVSAYALFSKEYRDILLEPPHSILIPEVESVSVAVVKNIPLDFVDIPDDKKSRDVSKVEASGYFQQWINYFSADSKMDEKKSAEIPQEKNQSLPKSQAPAITPSEILVDGVVNQIKDGLNRSDLLPKETPQVWVDAKKYASDTFVFFRGMKEIVPTAMAELTLLRYGYSMELKK